MTILNPVAGKVKIIVAGLDGAGKRTILDMVQNKMVNILDAQPRNGLARREAEIMGNSITISDLGGQGSRRKLYLSKPAYLEQTSALAFVVDTKDVALYGDAIEYFEQMLSLFNLFEMKPKIYLMFHKFDEEYRADYYNPSKHVRDEFMGLKGRFASLARKCGFEIEEAYRTSLSDMWSVYSAFYDVWTAIILRFNSIDAYLSRFLDDVHGVHLAILMDASCNVLAKKGSGGDVSLVDDLIALALNAIDLIGKISCTKAGAKIKEVNSASVVVADNSILICKLDAEGKTFYIIIVKESGLDYEARWIFNQLAESLAVFLSLPGHEIGLK